jgi:hypothetical protein
MVSKLTNEKRRSLPALAILGLLLLSATQPISTMSRNEDAFTITQDVLRAFYPEVFGNRWHAQFTAGKPVDDVWTQFRGAHLKVTRYGPGMSSNPVYDAKTGKMAAPPDNPTFLEGLTWIDDQARILQVHFEGDLAASTQRDVLRKLVESHPEWSEQQEVEALKKAGASFGPGDKEPFVNSLHLERAEQSLGRLKIISVDFLLPSADHTGNFAAGEFQWAVHAEAQLPDGTICKYAFGFEPFKGKLIDISRM